MTARRTMRRWGARVADVLLWLGALLGLAGLLTAAAVALFGFVPLVFTSGSMSPEIPAGSLGLARTTSATDLQVGDVVSVIAADGNRITHRIVAIGPADEGVSLTLRGDANATPDLEQYDVASVDRLAFSIPHAGRVVAAVATPYGMFAGGLMVAGLLAWAFRRGGPGAGTRSSVEGGGTTGSHVGDRGARSSERSHRRSLRGSIRAPLMAVLALVLLATPSAAAFTDDATVTTAGFATHKVAQPVDVRCAEGLLGLLSFEIATTSVDNRYAYVARAFDQPHGGSAVGPEVALSTVQGATRKATLTGSAFNAGLLELGRTYYIRVHAKLPGTTWYSSDYRVQPVRYTRVLVLGTLFECVVGQAAPTVSFERPVNGLSRTTVGMQEWVSEVCESGYGSERSAACGTVSDDGTVTSVHYILQRVGGTLGTRCWNGRSLWVTDCAFRAADRNGSRWSVPRLTAITYPYLSNGSYTLIIRAVDNDGNATESRINFALTYA